MNVQDLESEFRRVMKRFLDETHDFRERISAATLSTRLATKRVPASASRCSWGTHVPQ